jgi:hypothetical protein
MRQPPSGSGRPRAAHDPYGAVGRPRWIQRSQWLTGRGPLTRSVNQTAVAAMRSHAPTARKTAATIPVAANQGVVDPSRNRWTNTMARLSPRHQRNRLYCPPVQPLLIMQRGVEGRAQATPSGLCRECLIGGSQDPERVRLAVPRRQERPPGSRGFESERQGPVPAAHQPQRRGVALTPRPQ